MGNIVQNTNVVASFERWTNKLPNSTENDQQFFKMALKIYFVDPKNSFKFIDVWRFLSASLKRIKEYEEEQGGEKRTKVSKTNYTTSSNANFGVDLNKMGELKLEKTVRPMGRNRAKKKGFLSNALGVGSGSDIQKVASSLKFYNLNFERLLNFEKEKM